MHAHSFPPHSLALLVLPVLALVGGPSDDSDDESAGDTSQVSWLRALGDREALAQIMERDRQLTHGLEAAEALAELGDVRGLDHLIATLSSPSSYLRHQAAQILKRLNHPRGLRALQEHPQESVGSTRAARREDLYEDLDRHDTDELVAMWHERHQAQDPDLRSEVLQTLLVERLGKLPGIGREHEDRGSVEIDHNTDPRIQRLWRLGDVDGLIDILEQNPDVPLQLEAAEALADLGDESALDFLVRTLDDPEEDYSKMAAELLDWLDLPRGNAALEDRGFEFDTGPGDKVGASQPPSPVELRPSTAAAPLEKWVSEQQRASASPIPRSPTTQLSSSSPVWQQQDTGARLPFAILLTGAIGGLLGFIAFRLGLHLLGYSPLPRDLGAWLETAPLLYLAVSVISGAVFGLIGSRVARALSSRDGLEAPEGDLAPAMGALLEGGVSALFIDVLLYTVLGV